MITITGGPWSREYVGLSTDEKPTDIAVVPNASIFYEMDTGDIYFFDKSTATWLKQ